MPNRESFIKGPAKCVFNAPAGAATFFSKASDFSSVLGTPALPTEDADIKIERAD